MKNKYSQIIFLISVFILISCSDSNVPANYQASLSGYSLSIGNSSLSFEAQGGTINTTVNTNNIPWQFSGLPNWLTVSPLSGNSTSSVTFTATENVSTDITRTSIFYLESKEQKWSFKTPISASQKAAVAFITPATTSITFPGSQGSETIIIQSNTTWEAKSSAEWIKTEVSADGTNLTVSVESNPTDVSRSATITLSSAGRATANIQVIQEAAGVTGSTETLCFEKDGGSMSTSITAETNWEAKTSSSWITVSPASGNAGSHTLYVTVSENSSISERTGYVYVVIGSSSKLQIPVKQKGLFIETDINTLSFSADAEQKQLTISSNFEWTVLSNPEWLTISPMQGSNIQTITVSSQKNENSSSRRGSIIIGKEGLSISANIEVVQEGMTISVDNNTMEFIDKASSQDITITTIAEWNAISHDNWIHLSKVNGIGNSVLSVSVDENTSEYSRTGSFIITASDLTQTITVIQSGKYFNIDTGDKTFTSTGGTMQISFSTNESWTAGLEQEASWLTLSSASGNGDGMITVTAKDNPSMKARENAIIISPANSAKVKVSIKQSGRYLTVDCTELNFGLGGGTSQIITINSDGIFDVVSNEAWISVKMESTYTFRVIVPQNYSIRREGFVSINMKDLNSGENYALTISVIQKGNGLDVEDFVDLGLPSGTKWAKYNLGAKTNDELGDRYCWGETALRTNGIGWDSYKYCNGTYDSLTKYNTNSSYGKVDNLTSLQDEDDAAYIQTGGIGRMPTKEEVEELIKYCTFNTEPSNNFHEFEGDTWIYGMFVCKVTGPNGKSISIPIRRWVGYQTNCLYWTRDLYENQCFDAYCFKDYNYDKLVLNSAARTSALYIRPVLIK